MLAQAVAQQSLGNTNIGLAPRRVATITLIIHIGATLRGAFSFSLVPGFAALQPGLTCEHSSGMHFKAISIIEP